MSKTYVLTMAYSNPEVWRAGMASLYRTTTPSAYQHVVLDQHYPIRHDELRDEIAKLQIASGARVLDAGRNLGLHEGLNYMMEQIWPLDDDDIVVGFDADEDPQMVGWLSAMRRVFEADPKCGWLSLMSPPARVFMQQNGCTVRQVGGETVQVPGYSLINTLCAWRGSAIKAMGKFTEPHMYYGGFEGHMMPKCMDAGFWIGWMADYTVNPHHGLADPEYQAYKRRHVGFDLPVFPGSFEEWVRMKT